MSRESTWISQASSTVFTLVLLIIGLVSVASFTPATSTINFSKDAYTRTALSGFDGRLLADINHARASHGLRALQVTAGTTDIAHHWSCHLASQHVLAHNGRLAGQLATHGSRYWTSYAENVGYESATAGADALFKAYMNSPLHRANILDSSARFVGIWSKRGGAMRYNTIDFVGATSRAYSNTYGNAKASC